MKSKRSQDQQLFSIAAIMAKTNHKEGKNNYWGLTDIYGWLEVLKTFSVCLESFQTFMGQESQIFGGIFLSNLWKTDLKIVLVLTFWGIQEHINQN